MEYFLEGHRIEKEWNTTWLCWVCLHIPPGPKSQLLCKQERLVRKPENVIEISWPLSAQSTCWHNAQERSVQITHFRTWEQNKVDISPPRSLLNSTWAGKGVCSLNGITYWHPHRRACAFSGGYTLSHQVLNSRQRLDGVTTDKVHVTSLMGRCKVLDLTHVEGCITEEALASKQFGEGDIILFKTKNSRTPSTAPFNTKFVYLALSGIEAPFIVFANPIYKKHRGQVHRIQEGKGHRHR